MRIYYVLKANTSPGPYKLSELAALHLNREDLVKIGVGDWLKAIDHPEIRSALFDSQAIDNTITGNIVAPSKKSEVIVDTSPKRSSNWLKWTLIAVTLIAVISMAVAIIVNVEKDTQMPEMVLEESKPINPEINFDYSGHTKKMFDFLKPCNLHGDLKELIDRCDYSNPATRNTILGVISNDNAGNFNLGQMCDIYDFIQQKWKYVNDPGGEYVAYASETLNNGLAGDCDDFAVVLAAAIISIGGEARISYAYNVDGGHAFTEVNIGDTDFETITNYLSWRYKENLSVIHKSDKSGSNWINLDWFAEPKRPGGEYFNYTKGDRYYINDKYCEEIND